ncbi:MAG: hypothetical protein V4666_08495 [Bacteroidota bacterium]
MTTKNKIKDILIISNGVYWVSYLLRSFLTWTFNNPWQWFFELNSNSNLRFFCVLSLLVSAIFFLIYTNIIDTDVPDNQLMLFSIADDVLQNHVVEKNKDEFLTN